MEELSFEEEFPELKELRMNNSWEYDEIDNISECMNLDEYGEYIHITDIQNYCLDKARVKEAIRKTTHWGNTKFEVDLDTLLKELNITKEELRL